MNKAAASRSNGAKSQGPITESGKATSAQNARTHGLTAGAIVLAHESQTDYDALHSSYSDRFQPADEAERDLIREAVNARWRLRRIESMEAALFQKAIDEQLELVGDPDLAHALAFADMAENSKGLRLLHRYAKELRRSYEKAMTEFANLHKDEDPAEVDEEAGYAAFRMAMDGAILPSGSFRNSVELATISDPVELVPRT
jgi:hypothetical protein